MVGRIRVREFLKPTASDMHSVKFHQTLWIGLQKSFGFNLLPRQCVCVCVRDYLHAIDEFAILCSLLLHRKSFVSVDYRRQNVKIYHMYSRVEHLSVIFFAFLARARAHIRRRWGNAATPNCTALQYVHIHSVACAMACNIHLLHLLSSPIDHPIFRTAAGTATGNRLIRLLSIIDIGSLRIPANKKRKFNSEINPYPFIIYQ